MHAHYLYNCHDMLLLPDTSRVPEEELKLSIIIDILHCLYYTSRLNCKDLVMNSTVISYAQLCVHHKGIVIGTLRVQCSANLYLLCSHTYIDCVIICI